MIHDPDCVIAAHIDTTVAIILDGSVHDGAVFGFGRFFERVEILLLHHAKRHGLAHVELAITVVVLDP